MSKSKIVSESNGTSNSYSSEIISVAAADNDQFDIPPVKRPRKEDSLTHKLSFEYQRLAWNGLRKSINVQVNIVNESNLQRIVRYLFKDNLFRGRGILARAIIAAQIKSPNNTSIYVALVSIINRKFPQIGELISKRLLSSFRQTYQLDDKSNCLASAKFIAHLINQNILHEKIAFEILDVLLRNISSDSIELTIGFLKECGQKLLQVNPHELDCQFSKLNDLLDGPLITERTKNMIENLFAERTNQFEEYPVIQSDLQLVDENDQYKHMLQLDDSFGSEPWIDIFKFDEQYEVNEKKYHKILKTIFKYSEDEFESSSNSSDSDEEGDDNEEKPQRIIDPTETNLVTLRHKTCLTIRSNISAKECAKKLLKMNLYSRKDWDVCEIIVDICGQQPTYERFFGLVGEHVCLLNKDYISCFEKCFRDQYTDTHRSENGKLRNVTKFFAYLLATNSIRWSVFECIRLIEKNMRPSSCDFLKNLFLELFKFFGFTRLKNHLTDPKLKSCFQGLFLRDNPENARFCIKFFTSIGLGSVTDELHEYIISNPTPAPGPPSPMSIYNEIVKDFYDRQLRYEEDKRKKEKI